MNKYKSIWQLPHQVNNELNEIKLPTEITKILSRRGISNKVELHEYLKPTRLPNANDHFPQLKKAINRILLALKNKERIAICGDYDADGITSTILLLNVLRNLNAEVLSVIPSRDEDGYGLNNNIIKKLAEDKISLAITVDNGVSAHQSLKKASLEGIDIIVTDHHKYTKKCDYIYALIHPDTTPVNSPYKYLAGVGLAYILAAELCNKIKKEDNLSISRDLLCIGTIADMAILKGANRYWLKKYIPKISNTESLGLKYMLGKANIKDKTIDSEDISFRIAPRINSVGRISDPNLIVNCLLEKDIVKATSLANKCELINKQRKSLSKKSVDEAIHLVNKKRNVPFIMIAQDHWHHGIIGLIAARIMEIYKKPTAVLSKDNYGLLRGSVRSPKNFNVNQALENCSGYLEKYGGHDCAGGFTVKAEKLELLEEQLIQYTNHIESKNIVSRITPDVYIDLNKITPHFTHTLKLLEPYGMGNPKPVFWSRGCEVIKKKQLNGGHLIIELKQQDTFIKAIKWNRQDDYYLPKLIDIAFNIQSNILYNKEETQVTIIDFKPYQEIEIFKVNDRSYKCYLNKKNNIIIENELSHKIIYNIRNNEISDSNKYPKDNLYINYLISSAKTSLGINC